MKSTILHFWKFSNNIKSDSALWDTNCAKRTKQIHSHRNKCNELSSQFNSCTILQLNYSRHLCKHKVGMQMMLNIYLLFKSSLLRENVMIDLLRDASYKFLHKASLPNPYLAYPLGSFDWKAICWLKTLVLCTPYMTSGSLVNMILAGWLRVVVKRNFQGIKVSLNELQIMKNQRLLYQFILDSYDFKTWFFKIVNSCSYHLSLDSWQS